MDKKCDNTTTGRLGEEHATAFLLSLGYRILERNFRCKGGEVDIVAEDIIGSCLVFVEVKARRGVSYGVPQQSVTAFKQRQLSKAALTWIAKHRQHERDARFDVIAILLTDNGQHAVEHIKNAFELAY